MMSLTKQQKVLLAVLGVGGAAIAVDRLWLGESKSGPKSAMATVAAEVQSNQRAAKELDAWLMSEETLQTFTFVERLDELVSQRHDDAAQRDAFTPPRQWLGGSAAEGQGAPQNLARQFRAAHRLEAVMSDGQAAVAVIDGRPLRVGQSLDGYKLVDVQQKQVLFESPADNLRVALPLHDASQ